MHRLQVPLEVYLKPRKVLTKVAGEPNRLVVLNTHMIFKKISKTKTFTATTAEETVTKGMISEMQFKSDRLVTQFVTHFA